MSLDAESVRASQTAALARYGYFLGLRRRETWLIAVVVGIIALWNVLSVTQDLGVLPKVLLYVVGVPMLPGLWLAERRENVSLRAVTASLGAHTDIHTAWAVVTAALPHLTVRMDRLQVEAVAVAEASKILDEGEDQGCEQGHLVGCGHRPAVAGLRQWVVETASLDATQGH